MRAPSPYGLNCAGQERQKILSQGVDVPEKGCMMCGSLGQNMTRTERGAEAGSTIFDSVRR